jgi:hypothetical protein
MADTSDNEKQTRFFLLRESSTFTAEARGTILWAQNRIGYLESIAKDLKTEVQRLTDQLSSNPTNPESDEDRHQRHRRERMLDEITLMLVQGQMEDGLDFAFEERTWGKISRETAVNICNGINDVDATH